MESAAYDEASHAKVCTDSACDVYAMAHTSLPALLAEIFVFLEAIRVQSSHDHSIVVHLPAYVEDMEVGDIPRPLLPPGMDRSAGLHLPRTLRMFVVTTHRAKIHLLPSPKLQIYT